MTTIVRHGRPGLIAVLLLSAMAVTAAETVTITSAPGDDRLGQATVLTASAPTVVQPAWQWRHLGRAIPGQTADRLDALAGRPDTWYATGGQVFVWRWMRQHATFTRTAEGSPTFTVTRPWLHPYLATLPMTLRVPTGVTAVVWKGECRPVTQGVVDLAW